MDTQTELFRITGLEDFAVGDLHAFVESDSFPGMTASAKKNYTSLMSTLQKFYVDGTPLIDVRNTFQEHLKESVFRSEDNTLTEKSQNDYLGRLLNCLKFFLLRYESLKAHQTGLAKVLVTTPEPSGVTLEELYTAVRQADPSVFKRFRDRKGRLQFDAVENTKLKGVQARYRTALRYALLSGLGRDTLTSEFSKGSEVLIDWLTGRERQQPSSAQKRVTQVKAVIRNMPLFFEEEPEEPARVFFRHIYQVQTESRQNGLFVVRKPVATLAFQDMTPNMVLVALSRCNVEVDNFSRAVGRNIATGRLSGPVRFAYPGTGSMTLRVLKALFSRRPVRCAKEDFPRLKKEVEGLILRKHFERLTLVGSFRAAQYKKENS